MICLFFPHFSCSCPIESPQRTMSRREAGHAGMGRTEIVLHPEHGVEGRDSHHLLQYKLAELGPERKPLYMVHEWDEIDTVDGGIGA